MRRLIGSAMLLAATLAAGCAADRQPSLPEAADGVPRPPGSTTTTAPWESAECKAFASYSLAQAAIAFAADADPTALATGLDTASAGVRALLPQFADELQTVDELSHKDIQGTLTAAEAQQLQAAFAPLTAWNAEHCGAPASTTTPGP